MILVPKPVSVYVGSPLSIDEAGHQFGDDSAAGTLGQILDAHHGADCRQRGRRLADAAIDMTRLDGRGRVHGMEFEVNACESTEQRRPLDAQDAALCDRTALEDFLLQLPTEGDRERGGDQGDERAEEECEGRNVLCRHGRS